MLDCIVAACSQIGDSARAFETFAAYGNLRLVPGTQAYNAVLQGCIYHGLLDSVPKVRGGASALEYMMRSSDRSVHSGRRTTCLSQSEELLKMPVAAQLR